MICYPAKRCGSPKNFLKKLLVAPHVARNELTDPATGQTYFDDRLYVISADYLYVFDCVYGQTIWTYHLGTNGIDGFQPASGPYAIGHEGSLRVYIGDWEGRVRVVLRVIQRNYYLI